MYDVMEFKLAALNGHWPEKLSRLLPKHIPSFTPILIHLSEYLYEMYRFY